MYYDFTKYDFTKNFYVPEKGISIYIYIYTAYTYAFFWNIHS